MKNAVTLSGMQISCSTFQSTSAFTKPLHLITIQDESYSFFSLSGEDFVKAVFATINRNGKPMREQRLLALPHPDSPLRRGLSKKLMVRISVGRAVQTITN